MRTPDPSLDLIRRAKENDQEAYAVLYQRLMPRTMNICRKYTHRGEDFVELSHDTVVHILLRLDKFNGRAKFTTWAYVVALNVCRSRWRKGYLETVSLSELNNEGAELLETIADKSREFQRREAVIDLERILNGKNGRRVRCYRRYTA